MENTTRNSNTKQRREARRIQRKRILLIRGYCKAFMAMMLCIVFVGVGFGKMTAKSETVAEAKELSTQLPDWEKIPEDELEKKSLALVSTDTIIGKDEIKDKIPEIKNSKENLQKKEDLVPESLKDDESSDSKSKEEEEQSNSSASVATSENEEANEVSSESSVVTEEDEEVTSYDVITPDEVVDPQEIVTAEEVTSQEAATSGITLSQITSSSSTTDRVRATMNFLVSEGFTPAAAAGVVGNLAVESGFNPAIVSPSGYYGLFQWNTNAGGNYWWYSINDWLGSNGYSWDSYEGQVKAMLYCPIKGQLSDSRLAELKSLQNVDQATELFAVFYEACPGSGDATSYYMVGNCYQQLGLRKSEAWVAYNMYNNPGQEYNGNKPYYG